MHQVQPKTRSTRDCTQKRSPLPICTHRAMRHNPMKYHGISKKNGNSRKPGKAKLPSCGAYAPNACIILVRRAADFPSMGLKGGCKGARSGGRDPAFVASRWSRSSSDDPGTGPPSGSCVTGRRLKNTVFRQPVPRCRDAPPFSMRPAACRTLTGGQVLVLSAGRSDLQLEVRQATGLIRKREEAGNRIFGFRR